MISLHIASAQVHSGGSVQENLARIETQVRAAAVVGVDVILLAEGVLQGYDYGMTTEWTRRIADEAGGPATSKLLAMAKQYNIVILAGFIEKDGEQFYNSHLIAYPTGKFLVQRKNQLTSTEKNALLTPGPEERQVFDIKGVKCALIICADCSIPDVYKKMHDNGVQYLFHPCGGGGKMSEMLTEEQLKTEAGRKSYIDNKKRVFLDNPIHHNPDNPYFGVTTCNALGPVGEETCHQGHCIISDNNNVIRAQCPGTNVLEHMQDQMIHAIINFQ